MRSVLAPLVMGLALVAGSAQADQADPVEDAVTQPFRDLGLVRDRLPEAVRSAAEAPYRLPADCEGLRTELAALNGSLGPDVDEPAGGRDMIEHLLSEAIRGAVGLPFRGAVREITGTARRDRERAQAVLAATARRGFLRGLAATACQPPPTQVEAPQDTSRPTSASSALDGAEP